MARPMLSGMTSIEGMLTVLHSLQSLNQLLSLIHYPIDTLSSLVHNLKPLECNFQTQPSPLNLELRAMQTEHRS